MNNLFNYFRLLLLSTSGMLLLCIVFAINPELAHGAIMGKVCWFHFSSLLFAISILFTEFTVKTSRFTFSLPDVLLLMTFGFVLLTYNQELNLQPEKIIFLAQLTVLWFMLRTALQVHQELRLFYITIIIFTGIIITLSGIGLYEKTPTPHPLFSLMQKVVNSIPFAGYVSLLFPVCLNLIFRFKNCNKSNWWEVPTFLYYTSCMGVILIIIALSIRMNRPAWVATLISGIWVGWMQMIGWGKTKETLQQHHKLFSIFSMSILFILGIAAIWESTLKAENGCRRLLIWNVTTKAITEHPLTGTGLGGFSTAFARTQASYFSSGLASEKEKINAVCPVHAYNEYLQLGLELGIGGLLIFILWLAFSLYYGIKHRQIGASGGIVALSVFAIYSYPLQMPSFWVILLFLTVICVTDPKQDKISQQANIPYIGALAAIASLFLFYEQKDCSNVYKEWKNLKELHSKQIYDIAADKYSNLYYELQHRPDFLLEGADCYTQLKKYDTAAIWLKQALKVSSSPNIYYAIAQNEEARGKYEDAERYLQQIIHILPEKGYAYFLLMKLYSNPYFFQPEKRISAASRILELQFCKQSGISKEMTEEVLRLMKESTE
ncbi:tetratricopeptide repeat protein [Parabacteroides sp. AM08-6]|uniref:tetratricopeptide repeat protein n=1 Tax=Parabacteroides sp. AM08-6 TaxID=2292053 RepID=UPI000EFE9DF4|nr:tetratricopeptide repeat protein [Parabacteroides sp. AM08-6]RHJ81223.1 tetratricopeptide repeat protein [Parabacteroides sp. AM08-6]